MTYVVYWTNEADDQLADLWLKASDRADVTAASHRIEAALSRDPFGVGESREADDRIAFDPPLVVYYQVKRADNVVWVISVGRTS